MMTGGFGVNRQTGVQVSAAGVVVAGAGGPALAASLGRGIALTVTAADDSPISGLGAGDFSVSVLASDRNGAKAHPVTVSSVSEPLAGVYVIALHAAITHRLHGPFACVVDVRTEARDGAQRSERHPGVSRVLVPVGG